MHRRLLLVLTLAACGDAAPTATSTVVVALTATDPVDGTTYRLTPGARLAVEGGTYRDLFSLDGDRPLVSVNVPPGDYTARLLHEAGYDFAWPIERTRPDGSVDVVNARLVTPMPVSFNVPEGFSYALVLRFQLADGGITFAQGTIDTSVAVDIVHAVAVAIEGTGKGITREVVRAADVPPEVHLPAPGDPTLISLVAGITGSWTPLSSTMVCAPAGVPLVANAPLGLADLFVEAQGATEVCLFGNGAAPALRVSTGRFGAPTTPSFAPAGVAPLTFEVSALMPLPFEVLEGPTVQLARLNGIFTLPMTVTARVFRGGADWVRVRLEGDVGLRLVPVGE